MSGELTGYLLAVASMCIYGVYMSPKKLSGLEDSRFTFWMACGIIASASVLFVLCPRGAVTPAMAGMSVAAGLVWATGNFAYTLSISRIELTRSTPIKNLSALLGLLFGMAFLSEGDGRSVFKICCICLSGALIVAGAWLLSRVGVSSGPKKLPLRDYVTGCALALWAAVAFSIYTVPMKLAFRAGMSPSDYLFFMSVGIFCGMTLLALWAGWRPHIAVFTEHTFSAGGPKRGDGFFRSRLMAAASGLGLTLGQLMANYAVGLAGVAVVWPITKNSVAAVMFSVFVLKDVDRSSSGGFLWWGMALCLAGIIIMGMGV
ncbi:MAG: hypothetical protein IK083_04160 [Abditibacteriota bacterium]|nr:hypothetical protein [Abditibacteriota bacterium]